MKKKKDFNLTEEVILTFEREKEDANLLKKYKRNKKFNKVYKKYIILLILSIAFFISLYYIISWHIESKKNNEMIASTKNYISTIKSSSKDDIILNNLSENLSVDFDGLKKINSSCFGWIEIANTEISYPVVKYSNNEYYLSHSFDQSTNSAGWIFADYRNYCNGYDKNLIIYGHNRKDGTMFNPLNKICLQENWYTSKENQIIKLYTETRIA